MRRDSWMETYPDTGTSLTRKKKILKRGALYSRTQTKVYAEYGEIILERKAVVSLKSHGMSCAKIFGTTEDCVLTTAEETHVRKQNNDERSSQLNGKRVK